MTLMTRSETSVSTVERAPSATVLVVTFGAPDWRESALCAQSDPEAFFPEGHGSTRAAKRVCARCEVRAECLDYALTEDIRGGVWGGLSEGERDRLRRAANREAAAGW